MFILRRNWRVSTRSSASATRICPPGAEAFLHMREPGRAEDTSGAAWSYHSESWGTSLAAHSSAVGRRYV